MSILHTHPPLPSPPSPIQQPLRHLRNRQTARQTRTLDPQQIHKPLPPLLPPDHKILKPLPTRDRPHLPQLGPNPTIIQPDCLPLDPWQIRFDFINSLPQPRFVRSEIRWIVHPFHVRAEPDASADVEGEMRAETAMAGARGRVDEGRGFRV